MTNDEGSPNDQATKGRFESRHHSSLTPDIVSTNAQLAELLKKVNGADRIALDTEADSLHSYREKLCLLQISVQPAATGAGIGDAGRDQRSRLQPTDFIVDPLATVNLEPLRCVLENKEIVLHSADYDLRMLRRGMNLVASRIFDTMIAARLLGIREFSLAALVKRYFDLTLLKGSQKANWAQRPLPARMAEYAINDVHYLLPLAEKLEAELDRCERRDWLRQSCQRAVELAAVARTRNQDELWRIRGSGILRGRAAAVLRELWRWREKEAEKADRPPFHILQNEELLKAAVKFASGDVPDYRHFSFRRRQAFYEAAQLALRVPESEWPVSRRHFGTRPTTETVQRAEELRRRRDKSAERLGLEPSFIAPRSTLEAIAADDTRIPALLVPWQRQLLGLSVPDSEESAKR
jgi:ribonuclease D